MKINVTPHSSLLTKIGHASFSVSQSISELIANSLDAMPAEQPALIDVVATHDEVRVADNGSGMTKDVLVKAVRMAWPMREIRGYGDEKKSEFGLGMKTACASLGGWWCVATVTEESPQALRVAFDLDAWGRGQDWEADLEEFDRDELDLPGESRSGTVLTVRNLRVVPNPEVLRVELARIYAPHLRGKDVIRLDGAPLQIETPDLIPGSQVDVDLEVEGVRVKGWGALRKHGNIQEYGFHWYRKGQLIEMWDKSFINKHPSMRQIIGELVADKMPVNFTKKGFEKESRLWRQAVEELKEEFKPLARAAQKSIKEQQPDPWTSGEIRDRVETMEKVGKGLSVRVLDGEMPSDFVVKGLLEEGANETAGQEDGPERPPLVVEGKEYRWRHRFRALGEEGPILDYAVERDDEILIVSNTESPLADLVDDRSLLALLNVADAISRWLVEEKKFEFTKALAFRDRWLATAAAQLKGARL